MKKSTGAIITLCMFLIAFVSSMAGYIFGVQAGKDSVVQKKEVKNIEENVALTGAVSEFQDIEKNETEVHQKLTRYILREYDGKIALILKDDGEKEEIYRIYEISVSLLPQSDREALKTGIEAETLSEALQLVEDYL